jgi:hypothetical protein
MILYNVFFQKNKLIIIINLIISEGKSRGILLLRLSWAKHLKNRENHQKIQ